MNESTTYYDQPVLKEPVWKAYIPTYFFAGGLAGGCMALGAAAQLFGERDRAVVMPARIVATAGLAVSAGLLIADLGRPSRFYNMLRVFRPTSPMNVGTWILTSAGAATTASAMLPLFGFDAIADAAGLAAGFIGLGLASYTGVLLANTAVPAWQHGAGTLPPLFVASAAASAGSMLDLLGVDSPAATLFGNLGKLAELAMDFAWERSLENAGDAVARHVRSGPAHTLTRASQALTVASLVTSLLRRKRLSGALGVAGALVMRFAVMEAGRKTATDPRATFETQRAQTKRAAKPERRKRVVDWRHPWSSKPV